MHIQLNPGNSNCQGKLKLLRVIGVLRYRGFAQKDQKSIPDYAHYFSLPGRTVKTVCLRTYKRVISKKVNLS